MFNSNGHAHGFENKLLVSNKDSEKAALIGKEQICFLKYPTLTDAKNNYLTQFPQQLFIEVEESIPLERLRFEEHRHPKKNQCHVQETVSRKTYIENVNALKQHIQLGNIYEINYCITFEVFDMEIDPLDMYQKLNSISKAPYSCLAKLDNQYTISSSPELFLSKKEHTLTTKPIKGTAKRGLTIEEDNLIKKELYASFKERNENVMIVDVARNDMSRIAKKGSVNVDKLFEIESYQQVHQMVSTISCELKNAISFDDIIKASFPMASMTGAPKISAIQLIDEFEKYPRGPYSGTLGYINADGNFDLNVLIRSIFYDAEKKYLSFSVGSAITALCNPEEEYNECLLKAKAMMEVLEIPNQQPFIG